MIVHEIIENEHLKKLVNMRKRGAKVYCDQSKMKKHLFTTQEKAEQYMQNLILNARTLEGSHPERVYYCKSCGGWHITSKAHILQQHIDDGSAVINPTPIIIDTIPDRMMKHELMLANIRNEYSNWEKQCEACKKLLDAGKLMKAKPILDKLVKKKVYKKLVKSEKEYFTDWRERLVKKTLNMYRRLNNLLNGYKKSPAKKKMMSLPHKEEKAYVPDRVFSPIEIIDVLYQESMMLRYCFISYVSDQEQRTKGARYRMAKMRISKTSKILERAVGKVGNVFACFSIEGELVARIRDNYEGVLARLSHMIEYADFFDDDTQVEKLEFYHDVVQSRCELISPQIR